MSHLNRRNALWSKDVAVTFMLMAAQTDVLQMLDSEKIIYGVAEKNELLQKLLTLFDMEYVII